ncbi:MAG: hypothetical protein WA089_12750, partial [Anaerolineae bacterium]
PFSYATDVVVVGEYAYVVGDGMHVISIANPRTPVEVGSYSAVLSVSAIAIAGQYAYLTTLWPTGLTIISIANPAAPIEVGFYETPVYGSDVAMAGDYVFVADGIYGVRVISVANPTAPVEVGFYDTYAAVNVAVEGNLIFVADEKNGLLVLRFDGDWNAE